VQLVADLTARNVHARHLPTVDSIVDAVTRDARGGDLVVVMSNGGFGGIHGKLLEALAGAARP
jgi:UDP-N-acetylmuramate: L-alanyl-gamma-D-glutamyl-meso-diaminopimelate ligase